MKLINSYWLGQNQGETMATFGSARLVKKLDGKIELIGGTATDHADARERCSLFAPGVFECPNQRNQAIRRLKSLGQLTA
jgi:hypothetical protein